MPLPVQTLSFARARLMDRRCLLQFAAAALLLPRPGGAQAQVALSSAINRAARFRALSQRCAKAYAQIHLGVLPENARDILGLSQRLMQVGFDELARAALPVAITQHVAAVQVEAAALGTLLAAPPSKAALGAVSAQADRMLMSADRATQALEALARQATVKLVNIAGRQRMLSQRLAKNYMMSAAGLDSKLVREQLAQDTALFVESLALLLAAPLSTPTIRNELLLGQQQWLFFESALKRKPEPESLRTVATTSERVLEVMNNLTSLYEAALKDVLGQA